MKKTWKLLLILFIVLIVSISVYHIYSNRNFQKSELELIEVIDTPLSEEQLGKRMYDYSITYSTNPAITEEILKENPFLENFDFEKHTLILSRCRRITDLRYGKDFVVSKGGKTIDGIHQAKITFDHHFEDGKIFAYQIDKIEINTRMRTFLGIPDNFHYIQVGGIRRLIENNESDAINELILQTTIIQVVLLSLVILLAVVILAGFIIKKRKKKFLPFKKSE